MIAPKGIPPSSRLTDVTGTPRVWSIRLGMPKPTASTGVGVAAWTSFTALTSASRAAAWLWAGAGRWVRVWTVRRSSTAPATRLVPPMSTPMTM